MFDWSFAHRRTIVMASGIIAVVTLLLCFGTRLGFYADNGTEAAGSHWATMAVDGLGAASLLSLTIMCVTFQALYRRWYTYVLVIGTVLVFGALAVKAPSALTEMQNMSVKWYLGAIVVASIIWPLFRWIAVKVVRPMVNHFHAVEEKRKLREERYSTRRDTRDAATAFRQAEEKSDVFDWSGLPGRS